MTTEEEAEAVDQAHVREEGEIQEGIDLTLGIEIENANIVDLDPHQDEEKEEVQAILWKRNQINPRALIENQITVQKNQRTKIEKKSSSFS
mmetsp:Transcript_40751/g.47393  ORF Transcript_40751/g.47393 Transcript_40751/m.47393 type:complete len:91 (+) Transcript_40751:286-558(+)